MVAFRQSDVPGAAIDPAVTPRRPALRFTETILVLALLGALGTGAIHFGWLWRWNQSVYDSYLQRTSRDAPSDVLIVAIDEPSMLALGRWPWPRATHARLIERLADAGARAVALDILLLEPDATSPDSDARLVDAMGRMPIALPVIADQLGVGGQLLERLPMPALAEQATLGHVHVELDQDGVGRSVFLSAGLGEPRWETLAAALLVAAGERGPVLGPTEVPVPQQWVRRCLLYTSPSPRDPL